LQKFANAKIRKPMTKTHLTTARKAILEILETNGEHLTPAEIHQQLTERLPSLNLSTVYRSLDYLVEHELISVADIGTGSPVYERLSDTPHHHLVCLRCNHILKLEHEIVDPFFDVLKEEKDFAIQTNHLVLYGYCGHCQEHTAA
jgi:Fur family ferric uptake transcriptional regulator